MITVENHMLFPLAPLFLLGWDNHNLEAPGPRLRTPENIIRILQYSYAYRTTNLFHSCL